VIGFQNQIITWLVSCNYLEKFKEMKSRLLRMALTWAAPIVIGYVVKKIEERMSRKTQPSAIPHK